ncbi:hypothetical protein G9A89_020823 [Geosiphon pyriformis]|nr:hypothetical protein G9A89_020823 [Geosiphon pyriformis]
MKLSTLVPLGVRLLSRNFISSRIPRDVRIASLREAGRTFSTTSNILGMLRKLPPIPPKVSSSGLWTDLETQKLEKLSKSKKYKNLPTAQKLITLAQELPGRSPRSIRSKSVQLGLIPPVKALASSVVEKTAIVHERPSTLARPAIKKKAAKVPKKIETPGRGEWTTGEKTKLLRYALAKKYLNKKPNEKWEDISCKIPGRTPTACHNKFKEIDPNPPLRKATAKKWSPEEINELEQLFNEHPNDWEMIAKSLPGRTADNCKSKYRQKHPTAKKSIPSWNNEKIVELNSLVKKYGSNWEEIAKKFPGHTPNSCEAQFKKEIIKSALAKKA